MDTIDVITQYILAIVPAFTAIVSMVVVLGVGIGQIKKANRDTLNSVEKGNLSLKKRNEAIENQLIETKRENIELKKQMIKILAKLEHIHFIDNDDNEE